MTKQADVYINSVGYALATGDDGKKYYRDFQGKDKPNEIPLEWSAWDGGGGHYNGYGNGKYGTSQGFDFRRHGEINLWAAENSFLLSSLTTPIGANMNFNEWSSATALDDWSKTDSSLVTTRTSRDDFSSGTNIIGPYVCKLSGNTATQSIYQTISLDEDSDSNSYPGPYAMYNRRFRLTAWVNCEAIGQLRLRVSPDGVPFSSASGNVVFNSDWNTTSGADEQLIVTGLITINGGNMMIGVERLGDSVTTTTLPTTTAAPTSTTVAPASTTAAVTTTNPPPSGDFVLGCVLEIESANPTTPYKFYPTGSNLYCSVNSIIYKWSGSSWGEYCVIPNFTDAIEVASNQGNAHDYTADAKNPDLCDLPLLDGTWTVYGRNKFYGVVFRTIADYSTGTISASDNSTVITGDNVEWNRNMIGAWVSAGSKWYRIENVEYTGTEWKITIEINKGSADSGGTTGAIAAGTSYTITPIRTGYTALTVTYYNGSTWVSAPGFSDATGDFTLTPYNPSLGEGRYWFLCWDTDSMSSWAQYATTYNKDETTGYPVKISATFGGSASSWTAISQLWLLEDKDESDALIKGIVPYGDYNWLFAGYNYAYCKMTNQGLIWPTIRGADNWCEHVVEDRGIIYGNTADNAISQSTDIESGDFTTPDEVQIGTEKTSITGLAVHDDRIFVGKEDGVYYLLVYRPSTPEWFNAKSMYNVGFSVERVPGVWDNTYAAENFSTMRSAEGTLYMPYSEGLWAIEGQSLINLSPSLRFRNYDQYHGPVLALASGTNWHYMFIETNDTSVTYNGEIISFRKEGGDYVFHPLGQISLYDINDAIVWGDKLWACGIDQNSDPRIHYFSLADDDYIDMGSSGISVYYKVDDDSSWTQVGSSDLTAEGKVSFTTPVSGYRINIGICDANSDADPDSADYYFTTGYTDGGYPTDKKVFSSVTVTGEDFTDSPTITGIKIQGYIDNSDNPKRTFDFKVAIEDYVPMGETLTAKTGAQLMASLRSAATNSTITFKDVHLVSHICRFVEPTPDEQFVEIIYEAGNTRKVTNQVHVTLEKVV